MEKRTRRLLSATAVLALLIGGGLRVHDQSHEGEQPLAQPTTRASTQPAWAATQLDRDGDRIDDRLNARPDAPESAAERLLVECILKNEVSEADRAAFRRVGGQLLHEFKVISHGWTGTVAARDIEPLRDALGDRLIVINGGSSTRTSLEEALQSCRARPTVWNTGVQGNSNTTIAFIDSGIDDSHTDLSGRLVDRAQFTGEPPTPLDVRGHGTFMASVALGTGAASGVNPTQIQLTDSHGATFLPLLNPDPIDESFPADLGAYPGPFGPGSIVNSPLHRIDLPASLTNVSWTSTMRTSVLPTVPNGHVYVLAHGSPVIPTAPNPPSAVPIQLMGTVLPGPAVPPGTGLSYMSVGTGPGAAVTRTSVFPLPARPVAPIVAVSPANQPGTVFPSYTVSHTISYAGVGDGYNVFRGVAPGCNFADYKVVAQNGIASSINVRAAIDHAIDNRVALGLRILNLSIESGADPLLSDAVNRAVESGLVVVVAAGNSRTDPMGDLAQSELAITVGAHNDRLTLSSFSASGAGVGNAPGGRDVKPDLAAPGGSLLYDQVIAADSNDGEFAVAGLTPAPERSFPVDSVANDYQSRTGTSISAAITSGAAALVIDALEQGGRQWNYVGPEALQDALRVKALLLMTATEESTVATAENPRPGLTAGAKDTEEGFGVLNVDAAVEAAQGTLWTGAPTVGNFTTSGAPGTSRRCSAFPLLLVAGRPFNATLTISGSGGDLYLFSEHPDEFGNPILLASSTNPGSVTDTITNYVPTMTERAIVVVKKGPGTASGSWTLSGLLTPWPQWTVPGTYPTINSAIGAGVTRQLNGFSPVEIIVQPGTYAENLFFGIGSTIAGPNSLVVRSTNPLDPTIVAATVVNGGTAGPAVQFASTDTAGCVVSGLTLMSTGTVVSGSGSTATLDRNVVTGGTNGVASVNGSITQNTIHGNNGISGGGVILSNGLIARNYIHTNTATANGGGVWACNGTISQNWIENNTAAFGGGLAECHGPVTGPGIERNRVLDNTAIAAGGGMYQCGAAIVCNVVVGNTAQSGQGGGLLQCGGAAKPIVGNVVRDNAATSGGGLAMCYAQIVDNRIIGNRAVSFSGGGMFDCGTASLPIEDNDISGNTAASNGGGLALCGGTVDGCVVSGNEATQLDGGGLWFCPSINGGVVSGNEAGGDGGGLAGCTTVTGTEITSNIAGGSGGGVHGATTITGCDVTLNRADGDGGGIANSVDVSESTITSNEADGEGAGVFDTDGDISRCIINLNNAQSRGGGLAGCDGLISNNFVVENRTEGNGAGLVDCDGSLRNNTIASNRCFGFGSAGGGISGCNANIRNNILWGNIARSGPSKNQKNNSSPVKWCCVQDGGTANHNVNGDPDFDDDFLIGTGSSCIDKGKDLADVTEDYFGTDRPEDEYDIGAHELE